MRFLLGARYTARRLAKHFARRILKARNGTQATTCWPEHLRSGLVALLLMERT